MRRRRSFVPRRYSFPSEAIRDPREDRPPLLRAVFLAWFLFKALPFLLVLGVAVFFFVMEPRP